MSISRKLFLVVYTKNL